MVFFVYFQKGFDEDEEQPELYTEEQKALMQNQDIRYIKYRRSLELQVHFRTASGMTMITIIFDHDLLMIIGIKEMILQEANASVSYKKFYRRIYGTSVIRILFMK